MACAAGVGDQSHGHRKTSTQSSPVQKIKTCTTVAFACGIPAGDGFFSSARTADRSACVACAVATVAWLGATWQQLALLQFAFNSSVRSLQLVPLAPRWRRMMNILLIVDAPRYAGKLCANDSRCRFFLACLAISLTMCGQFFQLPIGAACLRLRSCADTASRVILVLIWSFSASY